MVKDGAPSGLGLCRVVPARGWGPPFVEERGEAVRWRALCPFPLCGPEAERSGWLEVAMDVEGKGAVWRSGLSG